MRSRTLSLEQQFFALLDAAAAAGNAVRSTQNGPITYQAQPIGDRPAGHTSEDAELVRQAQAAIRAHGIEPRLEYSSTDTNIPISLASLRSAPAPAAAAGVGTLWRSGMTAGLPALLAAVGILMEDHPSAA
jgi:hypothetical protein